jgi:methionyl-tRNA synthetase
MSKFYISTPIYYVNDVPHIGHMYSTIAADTIARYKRLTGADTFFLTGTDEHGQKIEQAATAKGLAPKELADQVVNRYTALWQKLGITNTDFIRTTDERHIKTVQSVFEKLQASGDIYLGEYEGWYCTPCESFWTQQQLRDGNVCPDCGRPTSRMKESSYFFKMSAYGDRLLAHIEANPDFIRPESRRNEVVAFVKEGLRDLSVSRVNFTWGIPVKNDPRHVIYVWVDALVNYISALGYGRGDESLLEKYWPADFHLVGKDILRFHSVYWPTMLMALGLELPKSIYAHGWWTVEGQKMSKSTGNVVDPFRLTDIFGVEQVKYFLLREVSFGLDGDFSYKALIHRINGDLANDFGNLVTRSLQMVVRYFDGEIKAPGALTEEENKIHAILKASAEEYCLRMNEMSFSKALAAAWELVGALNKYIDESKPWALAKEGDAHLATVLYTVADGLATIANMITPFMPETAKKLRIQLGLPAEASVMAEADLARFGSLKPGTKLGEITALFPRLDEKVIMQEVLQSEPAKKEEGAQREALEPINIDEFFKSELIAVDVVAAEAVPKSDKLLKITVFDGSAERIIVSGIAKSYKPDEIVGKKLVIVSNLKPAKLMGIQSNGMILSAGDGNRHNVLELPASVPAGTRIK